MSPNAPPNSVSLTSNYLEDIVPVDLHAIVEPTQDAVSTQNAANYDEGEKPLYDSYRAKQHTLGHLNTTWFLNVRFTLLALAVFSLLATGIGGGMFYHHLSDLVITVGQSGAERTATSLSRNLNQFLANHISAAKALSFAPEYEHAVANLDKESLSRANALLDWHCTAFSGAICYLMASDGTTVASSNRHSKASFVGGNYGFRPYFQQAMEGDPSIYFAEGVISKKRGIYFSAPIFSERNRQIIGVFAIKLPIKNLDALFSNTPGIIALASPGGIVFASNRSDWLYRSLQPLSDTEISSIAKTRQFGKKKPSFLKLNRSNDDQTIVFDEVSYLMGGNQIELLPGWRVIYLLDLPRVSSVYGAGDSHRLDIIGFIALSLISGVCIFLFYQLGIRDLRRRRAAEKALQYSNFELEFAVEQRTQELSLAKEESENYFNLSLDVLCIAGTDGYFKKVNPSFGRLLDYSDEELLGKPFTDFIHPDDLVATQTVIAEKLERGKKLLKFENRYRTKHGEYRWLMWTTRPVLEKGLFYATARDVTEEKETAQKLKHALVAAESANRAKSNFLANMSHELRTPLNSIIGLTEMLYEDAEHADTVEPLSRIKRSGEHLLSLINDVLDVSKIEAGRVSLKFEMVSVSSILKDVIEVTVAMAAKNATSVKVHEQPGLKIHSDKMRLRQIIMNLLGNACKFTEGGTIEVSATQKRVGDRANICIAISDTGIGMSKEQVSRLFSEYCQADSSITRKYGGTGLGLAISERLCRLMGGSISVESTLNEGSTFTLMLPVNSAVSLINAEMTTLPHT